MKRLGSILFVLLIPCAVFGAYKIEKIKFVGNKAFSRSQLLSVMSIREGQIYDEYVIKRDIGIIVSAYHSKGYLNVKVKEKAVLNIKDKTFRITFEITEGERARIRKIEFVGNEFFTDEVLRKHLRIKEGDYLEGIFITLSKYALIDFYGEHGFLYLDVEDTVISKGDTSALVRFTLREGKQVRVRKIFIEGLNKVRERIVRRYILLQEGKEYNTHLADESRSRIYQTGLFYSVKTRLDGLEENAQWVDVYFVVEEAPAGWVSIGGGWVYPLVWRLKAGWGHKNFFGVEHKIRLGVEYSFDIGEYRDIYIKGRYQAPYFFSPAIKGIVVLSYRRTEDEDFLKRSQEFEEKIGFVLLRDKRKAEVHVVSKHSLFVLDTVGVHSSKFLNSVSLKPFYDSRNDIANPMWGKFTQLVLERGGGPLGGDFDYIKAEASLSYFRTFFRRLIFAMRCRAGKVFPQGGTEIEDMYSDLRFELGGANSLRGYPEHSLGIPDERVDGYSGGAMLNVNVELRWAPISKPAFLRNLYFVPFVDGGSIGASDWDWSMVWGAGFGIRYITPIGAVRVEIAVPVGGEDYPLFWYVEVGHPF